MDTLKLNTKLLDTLQDFYPEEEFIKILKYVEEYIPTLQEIDFKFEMDNSMEDIQHTVSKDFIYTMPIGKTLSDLYNAAIYKLIKSKKQAIDFNESKQGTYIDQYTKWYLRRYQKPRLSDKQRKFREYCMKELKRYRRMQGGNYE